MDEIEKEDVIPEWRPPTEENKQVAEMVCAFHHCTNVLCTEDLEQHQHAILYALDMKDQRREADLKREYEIGNEKVDRAIAQKDGEIADLKGAIDALNAMRTAVGEVHVKALVDAVKLAMKALKAVEYDAVLDQHYVCKSDQSCPIHFAEDTLADALKPFEEPA